MIRKSGLITHNPDTINMIHNGNAGCMASVSSCKALNIKFLTKKLLRSYSVVTKILSLRLKSI